jgi:hypothetical protein
MRHVVPLVPLVLVLAAAGCDAKVKQCNDFIRLVNSGAAAMGRTKGDRDTPAFRREIAKRFRLLAADAGKLKLTDDRLRTLADGYRKLLLSLADAADARLKAAEARDEARDATARRTLADLQREEKAMVVAINEYCRGK